MVTYTTGPSPRHADAGLWGVVALAGAGLAALTLGGFRSRQASRDREALQAELRRLRAELVVQAGRARRIDHDLRTPIGTVANALEWMKMSEDDAQAQAEARRVIGRQVGRLTALAEQLRDLARTLDA